MKKLNYKSEDLGLSTFVFFTGFVLIMFVLNLFIDSNLDFIYFVGFYLIGLIFFICNAIGGLNNRRKYRTIKNNGIKFNGYIVGLKNEVLSHFTSEGREYSFENKLIVQYARDNKENLNTVITEDLNFNPKLDLGSRECSVYILNDQVYVTDFVKRKKGQDNILK